MQGMEVLCREWRCCAANGGGVQRMEVLCNEWRCCAMKKKKKKKKKKKNIFI